MSEFALKDDSGQFQYLVRQNPGIAVEHFRLVASIGHCPFAVRSGKIPQSMRTVVYQSYRTSAVPAWLTTCMHSVKAWAQINDYEYQFFDDTFLSYAPEWFRQRAQHQICPVTDLARLLAAKELISKGFDRTIWIDADVLVFAPAHLKIDIKTDFVLCHEIWMFSAPNGERVTSNRVNNSIAAFTSGSIHLDFLIDACLRIARQKSSLGKLDVGTVFLSQLRSILPFPLLMNVGTFGPDIIADIATGGGSYLQEYAQKLTIPLACANFCASLAATSRSGAADRASIYETAVANCLASQGSVINRFVTPQP